MSPSLRPLAAAALAAALLAPGCRGPRDPDLEARLAEARARAATEPSPPAPAAATGTAPATAPARVATAVVTRTDGEVRALLAAVPGEGPALNVELATSEGTLRCTLAPDDAPQTVANFLALALGRVPWTDPDTRETMRTPFYDGLTFHRTIGNFIIQTGNPGSQAAAGPGWRIPRERGIPGAYERPGVMGMVDADDDSHGSQFFITLRPSKSLADRFTPFGRCTDLDLAGRIAAGEKLAPPGQGKASTRPKDPVRIEKVTVSRGEPLVPIAP